MLTSFDSDGFSMGTDGAGNANTATFVAWNWKANGGTTVTNEDGSIDSTVQANTTSGFSIVTATSPSSGTWSVGHGLSKKPDMIIQKYLASSSRWTVWHNTLTSGQYLGLNETNAIASSGTPFNFTITDSVIGGNANYDATSKNAVYYVFHNVEGYSRFGTYEGNGNADGSFIYTGFKTAFVMVKNIDAAKHWMMFDTERQYNGQGGQYLFANADYAVGTDSSLSFDFLSNGFKARGTDSNNNTSGQTYIYMAFAEAPFKYANAR